MAVDCDLYSFTCHPTQVNIPQPGKLALDLSTQEGWKAKLI